MPSTTAHPASFTAFRGATLRGAPGFYRVGQDQAGRWSLVSPEGAPFYCAGVHAVRPPEECPDDGGLPSVTSRLRRWGFTAAGLGCDPAVIAEGFPYLGQVDFCASARLILAAGVRLPDVFDPAWPKLAATQALERCGSAADDRRLLGWVTDDGLDWGQPSSSGHPSLLQVCLSLEPAWTAYHAAWEFVLALHGGRLDAVAKAWGVALANKEVVREMTRAEHGLATRGYLRDEARWSREFARRYFTGTAAAIRAADPHHLILGCRFAARRPGEGSAGPQVMAECTYPAVDVAMPGWLDLPPADQVPSQPILAGDVCWTDDAPRSAASRRVPRLTSIERRLRRGRKALDRLAVHPGVVGHFWIRWGDEPGEQPPFGNGLVHTNGREAREHTELLAPFHARVADLRGGRRGAADQVD